MCPNHPHPITWNLRDGKMNGAPDVVARASSTRSRVISFRQNVIAKLQAQGIEDAENFIDECGLQEVMKLVS